VTRPYHSAVRARAALETRTAVLQAASDLFVEVGYAQASVAAIAERAGVAVNTVYTSVGGKPALIQALVGETAGDRAIDESVAEILTLPDSREVLRRTAAETGRFSDIHASILRILFANATADRAVATAAAEVVRLYRERIHAIAAHLASLGPIRTDVERAAEILWFYFGVEAWATVRGFGWEWAEAARWLGEQAVAALLPAGPPLAGPLPA
jgi:AcrR family transcriptional regulator